MDLESAPSDDLEALVGGSGTTDLVAAWLSDIRARPGSYPSVATSDAYWVFRRWCTDRGHEPYLPVTFARLMGMRFRKIHARFGTRTSRFFGMDKATAGFLRKEYKANPTPPEIRDSFKLAYLRRTPHKDTR